MKTELLSETYLMLVEKQERLVLRRRGIPGHVVLKRVTMQSKPQNGERPSEHYSNAATAGALQSERLLLPTFLTKCLSR